MALETGYVQTSLQRTLPMLRLTFVQRTRMQRFLESSKPCHVGIHWIALAEYSQTSTHVPGFQLFFRFYASFCIGHFVQATSSIRVNIPCCETNVLHLRKPALGGSVHYLAHQAPSDHLATTHPSVPTTQTLHHSQTATTTTTITAAQSN